MSSKKMKSNNHVWYICDLCKAVVQVKDTQVHKDNSCPVNETSPVHPFIRNEILYVNIEKFNAEEISSLRCVPSGGLNDYILLPVNALQLLKIPIGEPVVIYPRSNDYSVIPFVKVAWTIPEKKCTAYLTKKAATTNSLRFSDYVAIHQLNKHINAAKLIVVKCENNDDLSDKPDFMAKVKEQILNNIYCVGNKFMCNYFGKELIFEVVWLESENDAARKSENENVSLTKVDHEFFLITEETIWKTDKIKFLNVNNNSYKVIGGLSETLEEIQSNISIILSGETTLPELQSTKGFLIYGPSGVGKTSLVEFIAQERKMDIIRVESGQIFSKYLGEAEKNLCKYFEKAKKSSPSIILIEDLDVICPKINKKNDQEKRIVATLSAFLDKIHATYDTAIFIFATTCRVNDIDKSLRRPGRFGKEFEIHVPNARQRYEILRVHLKNVDHDLEDSDIREISDASHGFVGSDLISLISQAFLRLHQRRKNNGSIHKGLTALDFQWALSKVKPSAMKEVLIDVPNVKWGDIGGQDELKLKLRQAVEWPLIHENSFRTLGIVPPRGLLMFGPPGCSKTMIAKALATESKLNFISVKGPELFSKWVGESEKAVREVFRRARQVAPSVIFFDELDAIGGERNVNSGGTNVEERVLAQLLTELDGVEPLGNVTIVGATNRLDRIDPALLRPGRFDRVIYVPLPDKETRRQIFAIQLRKTPVSPDVDLDELVEKTEGYSGAEIISVCHEAAMKALEEDFASNCVSRQNFLIALTIVLPRTPLSLLKIYENYINK